jgi:tRNA/tmRNA/rRNA uracil-C5-methylase (TrmA/RlmC/RlmD family)
MNPAVGDKVTLTISDIAFGGEGVARVGEFVVFVPFVALGEVVEAEVTEVKKSFARAKLLRVAQAAPERVAPVCRYFTDCGGCQYQHLDYGAQLVLKRKQIADLFERVGKFDGAVVAPVIPCPQPYGYRNRIMIRSQWDKFKQGLNIGFIRADNRLVVDVEECAIAEPALNAEIARVRANPPPKGGIKVVLRIAPEGWTVPRDSFFQNNFFLLPKLVETVRGALAEAGARQLLDVYCGVGFFSIELAGAVERFIGVELDQLAISAARKNAAARGATNGEFIAGPAEELLAGLLGVMQTEATTPFPSPLPSPLGEGESFGSATVKAASGQFPDRLKGTPSPRGEGRGEGKRIVQSSLGGLNPNVTTVLLDPPRKGVHREMLELLRATRPAQVIYVSCHPATMARDLNILCAEGVFSLARVTPLDMFPQTQHVESVADIRRAI